MKISNDEWFELQFDQVKAKHKYGIELPSLPPDKVQEEFTSLGGRDNLLQARNFYEYIIGNCHLRKQPRILDFGAGWGRISRFFLRETSPERIVSVDTMSHAIEILKGTGAKFNIVHNKPRPPIPNFDAGLDLIFAYSVFSHLSEEYFGLWMNYFLSILRPGGYIAFTSRGDYFINHLEKLHSKEALPSETSAEHVRRLTQEMPTPEVIRTRYDKGEYQFYPVGGYGELTVDFFGEAFVPKQFIERFFGSSLINFSQDIPRIDQSVAIIRKPQSLWSTLSISVFGQKSAS